MRKNLELKARYPDTEKGRLTAESLGAEAGGTDFQKDFYFKTVKGLLKLRVSSLSGAYLIPYLRPREKGERLSRFMTIPVEDPEALAELFGEILGIERVVKKKRSIYFYKNVRIHLDEVENLGNFIEFEAVFETDDTDEREEKKKLEFLSAEFGISESDTMADSYYYLTGKEDEKS